MTGRIDCSSGMMLYQVPASGHLGEATVIPDPVITENCGGAALDQLGGAHRRAPGNGRIPRHRSRAAGNQCPAGGLDGDGIVITEGKR